MPVQTQMSSFAKKLGGRVAAANAEHKDKPVDLGMMRLPPGIRNGVAKIVTMTTKEYPDDKNGPGTKGQIFFRAAAVVISPEEHAGQKVVGLQTSQVISLCDVPAKGQRKAKSFNDNWYEFQNLFKLLGIAPPNETQQTDPTGQKTEAFYFAAMKSLTDPHRPPVYVAFSTRGWTPPPSAIQPKPEEMVFETWHGLAELNGTVPFNPGASVAEVAANQQPDPFTEPPMGLVEFPPRESTEDIATVVALLVETAMNDPEEVTEEEAAEASARLEELAWAAGWSKEQTAEATDWARVGFMALNAPTVPNENPIISVGSKWKFAKRTKDGIKLKDSQGQDFPAQGVEVTSVDAESRTCTVKAIKDGKTVIDIRSKKPTVVKFEWLE